jgi:hypothetical protein
MSREVLVTGDNGMGISIELGQESSVSRTIKVPEKGPQEKTANRHLSIE